MSYNIFLVILVPACSGKQDRHAWLSQVQTKTGCPLVVINQITSTFLVYCGLSLTHGRFCRWQIQVLTRSVFMNV